MNAGKLFFLLIAVFTMGLFGCQRKMEVPTGVTGNVIIRETPLFIEKENQGIISVGLEIADSVLLPELTNIRLVFGKEGKPKMIEGMVLNIEEKGKAVSGDTIRLEFLAPFTGEGNSIELGCDLPLNPGDYDLSLDISLKENVNLEESFSLAEVQLIFGQKYLLALPQTEKFRFRPALVLRAAGQDNCDTYRIPGLITTAKGTLISVYDNRYNNSKDLQEDIDVGMSRSTDGGQTWEPMKVIMDMGEWGGRPQRLNGIGDPSVLYDHTTHTIWVAAMWMSGGSPDDMNWWVSSPGMAPEETGQFILVKSTDDGLSWSGPINITQQIKDPEWQLLFAGPGRGITLEDGTLVFPGQFKEDIGVQALDGGQYTSHSTIVFSKDNGQTWQIGTGAKPNTTEAQVVQLPDGSLMLNMRDDKNKFEKERNNGRAVSITNDFGKTWITHPSSNSALPEPNCMASLIAHNMKVENEMKQVLFFSNPDSKEQRINMTIKASLDGGNTWPESKQILLNEAYGNGYSCMTMVDDRTIGIVYEGVKELYFQKIPVKELCQDN
ncbi:MAG: sialidase family protein [Bacteroides sp.]|nr:sialidase family protein [Bacteroides sp.]